MGVLVVLAVDVQAVFLEVVRMIVVAVRRRALALVVVLGLVLAPALVSAQVRFAILVSAGRPVYARSSCAPLLEEDRIDHTPPRFDRTPSTSGPSSLHRVQSILPSRSNIFVCQVSTYSRQGKKIKKAEV